MTAQQQHRVKGLTGPSAHERKGIKGITCLYDDVVCGELNIIHPRDNVHYAPSRDERKAKGTSGHKHAGTSAQRLSGTLSDDSAIQTDDRARRPEDV